MARDNLSDLVALIAVARERNFTRAAAKLGVSQSALSHTIRGLEAKLGLRLLNRTTRSVSPTEAGERLLLAVSPHLDEIEAEVAALSDLRQKPAGTIRISSGDHAADSIFWPALKTFLPQYPDIKVEVTVDYGLVDIVAQRFDAGIRFREQIEEDMIAIPIGPEMRMAVVGAPSYFARRPPPKLPRDLSGHDCINMRLPTYGGTRPWRALALLTCPRTLFSRISIGGNSDAFWTIGAPHFRVTTSTTRAGATTHPPLRSWLMLCAIGGDRWQRERVSIVGAEPARSDRSRVSALANHRQ
jgi:DNA-binding transcriptional LysR family regulator